MTESCTYTADVVSRQHLRSASQQKMIIPRYRLDIYGRRYLAVVGKSTWNFLPGRLSWPSSESQHFQALPENTFLWNIDEMHLAH